MMRQVTRTAMTETVNAPRNSKRERLTAEDVGFGGSGGAGVAYQSGMVNRVLANYAGWRLSDALTVKIDAASQKGTHARTHSS